MAQHFLLSSAAKTLTLLDVMRMSDQEAETAFRKIRWASTNGEASCPNPFALRQRSASSCFQPHGHSMLVQSARTRGLCWDRGHRRCRGNRVMAWVWVLRSSACDQLSTNEKTRRRFRHRVFRSDSVATL
jgi:hypothetical protein